MRRWGSAIVGHAGLAGPRDLVGDMPLEVVYTRAERLRSSGGRTLQHWAGRLAAKHAVLRLLGLPPTPERLGQVEILPLPTAACRADRACLGGHPPAVRLHGDLAALPPATGPGAAANTDASADDADSANVTDLADDAGPAASGDTGWIRVSISHTDVRAVALAVRSGRLPEDGPHEGEA
ncbi:phosphopantetheinyl transferase [Streptosporangium longisporum]|uniref:4'-phosphopantetheinyl transferase domain-containing protein n=1 Tax=Streptosporangium longisporum TaxID=46187 RepID=A0ABP6L0M9_9ACTN